jgi:hypothetical protein
LKRLQISHPQGLKISFSQPNLRKAGQLNLKFPATGYEAAQQEKFLIYSKVSAFEESYLTAMVPLNLVIK